MTQIADRIGVFGGSPDRGYCTNCFSERVRSDRGDEALEQGQYSGRGPPMRASYLVNRKRMQMRNKSGGR
jgi:hypothetical protein